MATKNIFGFAAPLSVENGGTGNNVLIGYIGKPGTAGFGVGICPTARTAWGRAGCCSFEQSVDVAAERAARCEDHRIFC